VPVLPVIEGRELAYQHGDRELEVLRSGGDVEDVFGAGVAVALVRAVALVEIEINVTALSGIGFLAANGGGTGQRLRFTGEPTIKQREFPFFDYPGTSVLLTSARIGEKMKLGISR
jgi:hypothetical protein